ncbi:MAG TPA: MFS transporter [Tepidisphaeraceae bacterium]
MSDQPPPQPKIAYEPPDFERPTSTAPTEQHLEEFGQKKTPEHDPYAAWRLSNFRIFIAGFSVTTIASQIQTVAVLYEIYQKTHSALNLGWVGLVLAVPVVLLALPAGQIADTHSRRTIVMLMQLNAAICVFGLALVSYFGSHWHHSIAAMYTLLTIGNIGGTFSRPARQALLPQLVPNEIFGNAVMWNSTLFETASVVGPAIGGFLCARSVAFAYLLAAACFCCSFVLVAALPKLQPAARENHRPGFADLIAGVRFVWRIRLMFSALTLDLFAVLLGGAVYLLPAFAQDVLHVGAIGFGWLRAAPSIGAISMAMIQAHRKPMRRAGRTLLIAVAGFGVATIIFGLSRNFWLSMAMLILTGAFDNISVVVRHTLVQMLTPDEMRGRVSAVNQVFIGSSNELGGMESGLTAAWLGLIPSVVYGGIGTLIVVIAAAFTWPEMRNLGSLQDIKPAEIPDDNPAD